MRVKIHDWVRSPAPVEFLFVAIGDVHGEAERLDELLNHIDESKVLMLGDYIDRGPEPIKALKIALDCADVCLPGNHEQMLVRFLNGCGDHVGLWFMNGGDTVARELGFQLDESVSELRTLILNVLGARRVERLRNLPNHHRHGRYLFVHAGIHPNLELDPMLNQDWRFMPWREETDPLWIRGPFLTHEGPFPEDVIVVHGHTPRKEPEIKSNRINLDTGACFGGPLTAMQFEGDRMRLIQVFRD